MYHRMKNLVANICTLLACFHVAKPQYDDCNMGDITLAPENDDENYFGSIAICWCNNRTQPQMTYSTQQSNCEWYNVCFDSNHWTIARARNICRRLGLPHTGPTYYNTNRTSMDVLSCNENNIKQCQPQNICDGIAAVVCADIVCKLRQTSVPGTEWSRVEHYNGQTWVPLCEINNNMNTATCTSLAVVTGLLVVLLVVITTGLVCTCVFTKWRRKSFKPHNTGDSHSSQQPQHQLDNPVYDGDIPPPAPPANYSSLGPAYEIVQDNRGAGHSYDIINPNYRRGRGSNQGLQQTTSTANDTTSDHDYHILEHGSHVTGDDEEHDSHVLESNNSGTEGERGQQDNNVQGGEDGDPLNYEVPTSKTGEDQEDYSKLKH